MMPYGSAQDDLHESAVSGLCPGMPARPADHLRWQHRDLRTRQCGAHPAPHPREHRGAWL
jgi:hypothetical protein